LLTNAAIVQKSSIPIEGLNEICANRHLSTSAMAKSEANGPRLLLIRRNLHAFDTKIWKKAAFPQHYVVKNSPRFDRNVVSSYNVIREQEHLTMG
jgi:hypothetical protein